MVLAQLSNIMLQWGTLWSTWLENNRNGLSDAGSCLTAPWNCTYDLEPAPRNGGSLFLQIHAFHILAVLKSYLSTEITIIWKFELHMVVAGRGQGGLNKKSTLVQNMSFWSFQLPLYLSFTKTSPQRMYRLTTLSLDLRLYLKTFCLF